MSPLTETDRGFRATEPNLTLPLLPKRRGLLYPNTAGAIPSGRRSSLRAVDAATNGGHAAAGLR